MNRTRLVVALPVLMAFALVGCATAPQGFEWGRYEASLYTYAKKPDQRPGYEAALTEAIEKGRKSGRLAPGLMAELGYVKLEDGDVRGAVELFEQEAQQFPESAPFMRSVIGRAQGQKEAAR